MGKCYNGVSGIDKSRLRPDGFYAEGVVRDYPVRDRKMTLHVKRRRWIDAETGKSVSQSWDIVAEGTRYSKEFAGLKK